jgi:hypothetical protein
VPPLSIRVQVHSTDEENQDDIATNIDEDNKDSEDENQTKADDNEAAHEANNKREEDKEHDELEYIGNN